MSRVHYLSARAEELPHDPSWLTPAEQAVLDKLWFEKRRNDWLLGRWVAKRALSAAMGLANEDLARWQILAAGDGAPEVWFDGEASELIVSISHSNEFALAAVAPTGVAVGCDIEKIEPRDPSFAETFLTRREQLAVATTQEETRPAIVTLLWSTKESVLKMTREGLRADTWTIEVHVPTTVEPEVWQPLYARQVASERRFHGWWRRGKRFIATIIADQGPEMPIDLGAAAAHVQ